MHLASLPSSLCWTNNCTNPWGNRPHGQATPTHLYAPRKFETSIVYRSICYRINERANPGLNDLTMQRFDRFFLLAHTTSPLPAGYRCLHMMGHGQDRSTWNDRASVESPLREQTYKLKTETYNFEPLQSRFSNQFCQ